MKEKLLKDFKEAMKNKEIIKKNTIQLLRAGILNKEKSLQRELIDDEILEIVASEIKKRKEVLKIYEDKKAIEQIKIIKEEISVLEKYMPEQISEEELDNIVEKYILEFADNLKQNKGKIIKNVKNEVGVRAEGRIIAEKVNKKINERKED